TSASAIENRLAYFRRRCAELGLALTPQRLAIYRMLAGDASHPTAEDIFRCVKPAVPSLSLGTVYRTLELFEEHGLVSRVHPGRPPRFDATPEEPPPSVSIRCRPVQDYQDPRLQSLPIQDTAAGFRVLTHHIQLLGLCPACQQEEAASGDTGPQC